MLSTLLFVPQWSYRSPSQRKGRRLGVRGVERWSLARSRRPSTFPKEGARALASSYATAGVVAMPSTTLHLARWLAKEWDNYQQHVANPPFWAHIRVSYRPLPWDFMNGHAFYVESVYEYAPRMPYRATIIKIMKNDDGLMETESYKIEGVEEFYMAAFDRSRLDKLIQQLHPSLSNRCVKLPDACNAIFKWSDTDQLYRCRTRPGKKCIVHRNGRESYLDTQMTLSSDRCTALDVGRCPSTDEMLWGAVAGAFDFVVKQSWSHEVPIPPE